MKQKQTTALIGVGNLYRNDDGVGIYSVKQLEKIFGDKFLYFSEDISDLIAIVFEISQMEYIVQVIFIDASDIGGKPGDYEWIYDSDMIEKTMSTHEVPLPLYFGLLNKAGKEVKLLAIQPADMGYSSGLSTPLLNFVESVLITLFS